MVCADRVLLAIAIVSNAPHFELRQAIRDTWLNYAIDVSIRHAFIVGVTGDADLNLQVTHEANEYGDLIIMEDFPESYRGIVHKTRRAVEWAFGGDGADFLFKCDDDSYVVLNELVRSLLQKQQSDLQWRQVLWGDIFKHKAPIREPDHRWFVSHEDWPAAEFPFYATGAGYAVGSGLGEYLLTHAPNILEKVVPVEDVTMGIWLHRLRTEYNQTVMYIEDSRIQHSRLLTALPDDIVGNPYTPDEMRQAWFSGSICI